MSKVVIIDFMAKWCGPCRMQDPIIEKLKEKFKDKVEVEFKKVDVDEDGSSELISKYAIHAVPTLVIEKDEKLFEKYVGVTDMEKLGKKIEEALG